MDPAGTPEILVLEASLVETHVIGGVAHRFSGGGHELLRQFVSPRAKALAHPVDAVIGHSDLYSYGAFRRKASDGALGRRLGAWGRERRFRPGVDMCLHARGHWILSVGPTSEGEEAGRFRAGLG